MSGTRFGEILVALLLVFIAVTDTAAERALPGTLDREAYESPSFGWRMETRDGAWSPWRDLGDDYPHAEYGLLSHKGYGAVVLPMCWEGERPTELALLDVFMAQFGEQYPTPFVREQRVVHKGEASGSYLFGIEPVGDEDYAYHFWVVANARCAYTLAAWGPARLEATRRDLNRLWQDFDVLPAAAVFRDGSASDRASNAYLLSQLGMHYHRARAYRTAFRYFEQATRLDETKPVYLANAMRSLAEIEAYDEAYGWLQPQLGRYGDNQVVQSWEAWLAYRAGDSEAAVERYARLFDAGYREDQEFAVFAGLLADRGEWQRLDRAYDAYLEGGSSDALVRLRAELLHRRGRHAEALIVLDGLIDGKPFDPDLVYTKIEIVDEIGDAEELRRLAGLLIDNDYRSLESYFYRGYAEYQLQSYRKARESFRTALGYSPTNSLVKDYLKSIDGILGEGQNAGISRPLAPVPLPAPLESLVDNAALDRSVVGYGAWYINRITGYAFDGDETLAKTWVQQIKIQDARGVEQFSTLEFDFDPAYEQFYVNRLVVRAVDGSIIGEGDASSYYVTSSVDGYEASTERTAHLPVPGLVPGAVIEVVATKQILVDDGEFPLDTHYLASSRPIGYSAVFVTGEYERLRHAAFGVGQPALRDGALVWELTEPVVYRWEPMQPYYDRLLPWVTLATGSNSWDQAGSQYLSMIDDKLTTDRVADTAERLVRAVDDERQKVELISRFVQKELHYEAIEFGRRAYVPKTARQTLVDRYGDCKDHSVLLYSMLNAVGLPARLALVNSSQRVLPELPDIDQFDHMIVAVPVGDDWLYVDTTDKTLGPGRTPPRYLAGSHALVLAEEPALRRIPELARGDSGLRVEREIAHSGSDELHVHETGVFSGYHAADLRERLREIEQSDMRSAMQRWVADRYAAAIVERAQVSNLFETRGELVVELEYRLPLDEESFRLPGFLEVVQLDFQRQPDRRFGFELSVPFSVSAVTTIRQSSSLRMAMAAKKPDADESRFASWRRSLDRHDSDWVMRLDYSSGGNVYGADDYGAFTEFHRKLIGAIEQPMLLE